MRPLVAVLCVAAVVGCRKKTPEAPTGSIDLGGPEQREHRPEVVGPIRWWDENGLCMDVPDGWTGSGKGSRGRLLTLTGASGVVFEILDGGAPKERADLTRTFADSGTYRDIPALGPSGVETWVSDIPGGHSLQVWTASVRGAPVRFEAHYPFGNSFTGKAEIAELLRAVCVD